MRRLICLLLIFISQSIYCQQNVFIDNSIDISFPDSVSLIEKWDNITQLDNMNILLNQVSLELPVITNTYGKVSNNDVYLVNKYGMRIGSFFYNNDSGHVAVNFLNPGTQKDIMINKNQNINIDKCIDNIKPLMKFIYNNTDFKLVASDKIEDYGYRLKFKYFIEDCDLAPFEVSIGYDGKIFGFQTGGIKPSLLNTISRKKSPGKTFIRNEAKKYIDENNINAEIRDDFKRYLMKVKDQDNTHYYWDVNIIKKIDNVNYKETVIRYDEDTKEWSIGKWVDKIDYPAKNNDNIDVNQKYNYIKTSVKINDISWHPDNKSLWFTSEASSINSNSYKRLISVLEKDYDTQTVYRPFYNIDFDYHNPTISPDKRWLAVYCNDTLVIIDMIYNTPYFIGNVNNKIKVVWSSDSSKIMYVSDDGYRLYVHDVYNKLKFPFSSLPKFITIKFENNVIKEIVNMKFFTDSNDKFYIIGKDNKQSNIYYVTLNADNNIQITDIGITGFPFINNFYISPDNKHLFLMSDGSITRDDDTNKFSLYKFNLLDKSTKKIGWISEDELLKNSLLLAPFNIDKSNCVSISNDCKNILISAKDIKTEKDVIVIYDLDGKEIYRYLVNNKTILRSEYMLNDKYSSLSHQYFPIHFVESNVTYVNRITGNKKRIVELNWPEDNVRSLRNELLNKPVF